MISIMFGHTREWTISINVTGPRSTSLIVLHSFLPSINFSLSFIFHCSQTWPTCSPHSQPMGLTSHNHPHTHYNLPIDSHEKEKRGGVLWLLAVGSGPRYCRSWYYWCNQLERLLGSFKSQQKVQKQAKAHLWHILDFLPQVPLTMLLCATPLIMANKYFLCVVSGFVCSLVFLSLRCALMGVGFNLHTAQWCCTRDKANQCVHFGTDCNNNCRTSHMDIGIVLLTLIYCIQPFLVTWMIMDLGPSHFVVLA